MTHDWKRIANGDPAVDQCSRCSLVLLTYVERPAAPGHRPSNPTFLYRFARSVDAFGPDGECFPVPGTASTPPNEGQKHDCG